MTHLDPKRVMELRELGVAWCTEADFAAICDAWLAQQWQPIATAPRDWLLLTKSVSGIPALAFFNGIYWHDEEGRSLQHKPAEWRFVDHRYPPAIEKGDGK